MKKTTRSVFVYFRYALPLILAAVLVLIMLLPTYRFVTAEGVGDKISLFELMENAFSTSREYIFGTGDKQAPTMDFSVTLLILVMLIWLAFFVGLLSAIAAVLVFIGTKKGQTGKARLVFVTLTVNRALLCTWHALMLPAFLLPHILPLLYKQILAYRVELICEPFDMGLAALALFAITVAVIFFSHRAESLLELDVYHAPSKEQAAVTNTEEQIKTEDEPADEYEAMMKKAKEEQAASILRLLNKDTDSDEDTDK